MLKRLIAGTMLAAGLSAGLAAQTPRQGQEEQVRARYNIFVMEGVLERAVEHGADLLSRQVRTVMPDMLLLSGSAQARGFRLEGYGVFFDVEVPMLRPSVAWTLRTMVNENGIAASEALAQIKAHVMKTNDPRAKEGLEQALRRIEMLVGPVPTPGSRMAPPPGAVGAQSVAAMAGAAPSAASQALMADPSAAYEAEVKTALIDAMLDHSGAMNVAPEEWLTVAAREEEHRDRMMPGDAYDVMTIVLRIKGSDLAAYRANRLSRDEARKRVEIREF